ncbi:MAG: bacteriohemerythrin [Candidatus Cloacimonetes bacterium]|nr:bacteriohemerythrin [Candidatus Cloacimonadota bacterium]
MKTDEKVQKISSDISLLISALNDLGENVGKIAAKDFSQPVKKGSVIGLDNITREIENMRISLVNIVREINENAYVLVNSSQEMTSLSENMKKISKKMNDKAKAVAEDTNAVNENMTTVSAAAEELSVNMKTVSNRASESSENITNISASVEEMTATFSEIAKNSELGKQIVINAVDSVKKATREITELAKSAKEINKVTDVISVISDQTKLLALNATIEAARAGEAGIRFSVVASEVKALASQTNKATKDIQEKVTSMQRATEVGIAEIQNINKIMEGVNEIVTTIATSVEEQSNTTKDIALNINNVANGINDMSLNVNEAALAIQEVTENITQAALRTNNVAAAVNEVSDDSTALKNDSTVLYAGAMEVNSHSNDLSRLVSMIKLPAETGKKSIERKLFKFSEPYSVKVHEMDEQHKGIFEYINRVHKAIQMRKSQSEILSILKEMAEWTKNHFAREEELMKRIKYEGYDLQKKLHTKLLNDLSEHIRKIMSNEETDLIHLMIFLKDWLVNHIMGVDKKYSNVMNKNGIA